MDGQARAERIATNRVVTACIRVAISERNEARQLAKRLVKDFIKTIKEAELPWEMRKKAEGLWDLIGTDGLREKWVVDPLYDDPAVTNFWMSDAEDEDDKEWEETHRRELLDEAVDEMLTRMRVIGPRAKEEL
jgi:hypothetical protein